MAYTHEIATIILRGIKPLRADTGEHGDVNIFGAEDDSFRVELWNDTVGDRPFDVQASARVAVKGLSDGETCGSFSDYYSGDRISWKTVWK